MRRDPRTGLVHNEKLLLLTLLEMPVGPFHPYMLTKHWKQTPNAKSLPYSTLYRCLNELEQRGLVTSTPSDTSDGPTRRQYTLTGKGTALANELATTIADRLTIPGTI